MKSFVLKTCSLSIIVFVLTACDIKSHIDFSKTETKESKKTEMVVSEGYSAGEQGHKLTDVAGQVIMPAIEADTSSVVPENARKFIGRYSVTVSCDDPIVFCEQGSAQLIVSLLNNGTAHRTIIHSGKVTYTSDHYRKAHWFFDEKNNQIVLERANGMRFYFNIDRNKNLLLDVAHLLDGTETNKKFYERGYPLPQKAYIMVRENQADSMS